ncbi:MAG: carboxypeptidase-like regulatory domain-containing protein, partial [Candidatus Sulfotelmatobacter sp.]
MPRASLFIIIRRLFCSLLLASLAFAQDAATGAIRGIVLDPTGSRIAQASIVAVNSATGARYSTTSDAEGRFSLELLPPGDYTARAVADGMSPQVTPQLHVDVGAAAELEFHLTIAGLQENVTVSSAPRLVDTNPSAVNTLIDERAIADLPLTGRRFSDLMLLSPGVTQDPRNLTSATNGDLSFGGLRGFQNSFLVDGGDFNNAFFAQARGLYRAPYQFSNEVVQEFRVSSNSYGAENASTLPATGDQTTYSSPASPVTYDSISDNGEETVSTDTGSVSLTSGLTTRLISHLRAQFSRDLRQSYTNTNDTPIKIPDIIDGTGRSDQLPRATREHRAQLAETLRLDTSRHSFKFGGDSLVTWIYDFFPSQQSGECLFDVIKV